MIDQLPTLGVGVSLSLSEEPDPVMLSQQTGGPQFVEYAGLVDVDRVMAEVQRVRDANVPILFHPSYLNFCGTFSNSNDWLQATAHHIKSVDSPWFAQDCAYCFWQDGHGYSSQFGYFIPPLLNEASLNMAVDRIKEVIDTVETTVAIEPPPVTYVAGNMPVFEFFGQLAERSDCALLLDMGHLVSYEMATRIPVIDAIETLPVERVIEVHIAGGKLKEGEQGPIYIDAHESPILDETWNMLDQLLPLLPNVKALCYECEGVSEDDVMSTLKILRNKVNENSLSKQLIQSIENIS